jgi:2-polyprenyl-6-methoxyphenol hydroxylase-like FAD-dependent oxidoreductase
MDGAQGNLVAVVWSIAPERALALQQMDPETFCQRIQEASQHALGTVTLAGERRAWALQRAAARRWCGHNAQGAWALAGDAAHNVHPLAGQGLNLGLADVAELVHVMEQREYWRSVGDARLLRRYERARKAGMWALDTGMDGLQRLFNHNSEPWASVRNWGLQAIERSGGIKHWLARRAMSF